MSHSRIDKRGRTTLPADVREALQLQAGDELAYDVEARSVALRRADAAELVVDPFRHFDEWSGDADTKAYAGL